MSTFLLMVSLMAISLFFIFAIIWLLAPQSENQKVFQKGALISLSISIIFFSGHVYFREPGQEVREVLGLPSSQDRDIEKTQGIPDELPDEATSPGEGASDLLPEPAAIGEEEEVDDLAQEKKAYGEIIFLLQGETETTKGELVAVFETFRKDMLDKSVFLTEIASLQRANTLAEDKLILLEDLDGGETYKAELMAIIQALSQAMEQVSHQVENMSWDINSSLLDKEADLMSVVDMFYEDIDSINDLWTYLLETAEIFEKSITQEGSQRGTIAD